MSKLCLLIFASDTAESKPLEREVLTAWLDKQAWCESWFYNIPGSVFLKSKIDVKQMSEQFEVEFGIRRHLFVLISGSPHWGRMPQDHWDLYKDK